MPSAPQPGSAPLDHLARQALHHYGIETAQLTFLRQGDNTVYRVEPEGEERLVLRLHTAGRHSSQSLNSELRWLDVLSHTALPVPQPVMTTTGTWVARLETQEQAPVLVSLLRWVAGEALGEDSGLSPTQATEAGALLAQLHRQAESFPVPEEFVRPRYDLPYFLRCADDLNRSLGGQVAREQLGSLRRRLGTLVASLPDLRQWPGGFGLIHADPHPGNFVQGPQRLGLIDFDRCGWGPFLLDLAHVGLDLEPPIRQALMSGYLGVRPLPDNSESALQPLWVLAAIENLAVLADRPHERPFVAAALPSVEGVLTELGF
jgi:Ser/Thr protein kinase RdoA (MazF antagonist)